MRPRTTSRSDIFTLVLNKKIYYSDLVLVSNSMLCRTGNRLGPFSGVSDQCEGQEQVGEAVGDQGEPGWVVDIQDLVYLYYSLP